MTAMKSVTLADDRVDLVRRRALEGVSAVLSRGEALTYAAVAEAAGIAERTLYRHFPTRAALLAAVFEWTNERIGFRGEYPGDEAELVALVRRAFPGFDAHATVIEELLLTPEGRQARLASKPERQRATTALVRQEAPGMDRSSERRTAAVLQLLSSAATWQSLRDYWDMDGAEAAETAALAVELLLNGARARGKAVKRAPVSKSPRHKREAP
jgi:AcrR family transcriptional regulator